MALLAESQRSSLFFGWQFLQFVFANGSGDDDLPLFFLFPVRPFFFEARHDGGEMGLDRGLFLAAPLGLFRFPFRLFPRLEVSG